MKATVLGALALAAGLSAQAALYTSFTDTVAGGSIPKSPFALSETHVVSGANGPISSVILVLDFSSPIHLTGTSSGIQGALYLGTSASPTYAAFSPGEFVQNGSSYECTLSFASPFANKNPNSTWTLSLYDNNTELFGNSLVSWGMQITPVPEPLNVALSLFGVLVVGVGGARWWLNRRKLQTWAQTAAR